MLKEKFIKCPYCEAEYCASEIFYPGDLIGNMRDVIKDDHGKIIFVDDETPTCEEEYCCDICGRTFKVKADVFFKTLKDDISFEDEF